MNCKSLFRGPLTISNCRRMSNACRAALVAFLFDNRDRLGIPSGFFVCFLNPPKEFINPLDLYNVCRASNIDSVDIVKQYNSSYKWAIRVYMSYFNKF